jgi:hypothetical protein
MNNFEVKERLKELIAELKAGKVGRAQFLKEVVEVARHLDLTDEQVKSAIPFLISAINQLIKEIEAKE